MCFDIKQKDKVLNRMVEDASRICVPPPKFCRARGFDLFESFPNTVTYPYFKLCVAVLTPSVPELSC